MESGWRSLYTERSSSFRGSSTDRSLEALKGNLGKERKDRLGVNEDHLEGSLTAKDEHVGGEEHLGDARSVKGDSVAVEDNGGRHAEVATHHEDLQLSEAGRKKTLKPSRRTPACRLGSFVNILRTM